MEGIGLECLAPCLRGDAIEDAGAKEIDDDRGDDHAERPDGGLDRMGLAPGEPVRCFPDDDTREQEQERRLRER